jgi:ABC-type branched-subunit amino acid transport system ATPase component
MNDDVGMRDAHAPVLEARGITVRFGAITALDNVDVEVSPGTIVGLVGPNGAGKSTLFDALCGLTRPNHGEVWLRGMRMRPTGVRQRAHLGLARTFQHPQLFAGLTVREHLVLADRIRYARKRLWTDLFTARSLRAPDPDEDSRVDELMAHFGIMNIAHLDAIGLPMGLSRQVEVARALATVPDVLLLDEPAAGLDRDETRRLATALTEVAAARHLAILLVEHDLGMVLAMSSTVYVLDFGRVIAEGTADQIRENAAVRSAYLGSADTAASL